MSILEILAQKNLISTDDIPSIKEESEKTGVPVDYILIKKGITQSDIVDSKAQFFDIPVKHLNNEEISDELLEFIPEESAVYYKFVPLAVRDSVLEVGIVDPDNIEARDALNFISSKVGMPFKLFIVSDEDFQKVIEMYKGLTGEVTKALSEFDIGDVSKGAAQGVVGIEKSEGDSDEEDGDGEKSGTDETKIIEDAPVTKIVATILRYATEGNASDIHLEHMRENVRVRFRVDGTLNTSLVLPKKVHSAVVARIKILANLRLDEKRKPQDGRFSAKIDGRKIDFRVSTFPTYYGEKVVMRILDQEKGVKPLSQMGLSERNLKLIKDAIERPYGIILISGPTGSGKTTTLYSMINEVDLEKMNVLSLEDPIEYNIEGLNQSQVRPEIGYTFANGLRTTLRQDPDVIMVGEIRDKETAQLAIQAALTGHLVLSTIHTNNAVGVIPRLMDMGVDPYLIAPTLILAIAQRLVPTLCPKAGKSIPVEDSIKMMLEKQFEDLPEQFRKDIVFPTEVFDATGTAECPNGTRGRAAVMEVLAMDKDIEAIVLRGGTELEIAKIARAKGVLSMKEDAILKAFRKEIPFSAVSEL